MSKIKWLDRSLVVAPIHYGLCTSQKAFDKALKKLGVPKAERPCLVMNRADATTHFFENDGRVCAIVGINKANTKSREISPNVVIGLLIHEAVHVWQEIRRNLGEDCPSAEFEAYSIQRIAQNLIEAYND